MIAKFRKKKKLSSWKNIFFSILFGVLFLLVIGFLIVTNLKTNQRRAQLTTRITSLKGEIEVLEQKNQELKENISQAGSKESLERAALEQLGLKPSGTEVVVITKEKEGEKEEVKEEEKTWWEKFKSIWKRD
ncbi:hypothetical protein KJA13_00880 [Patescibacteria group bacterium]|nr:hypothetical protein [Patescibacteria group bacterium]